MYSEYLNRTTWTAESGKSTRQASIALHLIKLFEQRAALHGPGHIVTCQLKQCGSHVEQPGAAILPKLRTSWRREDEPSVLRMVASIRSGIILFQKQPAVPNAADRSPIETAEENNQIRSYIAYRAVNFTGLVYLRIQ